MNKEIEVEKTIKTAESVLGKRFDEETRLKLSDQLLKMKSSAGFSDDEPPDSPRPMSNSPQETGKNSEFGPTELR